MVEILCDYSTRVDGIIESYAHFDWLINRWILVGLYSGRCKNMGKEKLKIESAKDDDSDET